MQKIHLAVLGCGRIGKMHVDLIRRYYPSVNIKSIVDSQLDPHWAKERNLSVFPKENIDQVLNDDEINTVLIAASSSEHVNLIKLAAEKGKHIFCEKPIAFSPEEIQEAIDAVKIAKVKIQVGFNRRFDPEFSRVKSTVTEGKIGNVHIIRITNRDPKRPDLNFIPRSGGLFLDFNIHDIDTARFVSGAEVDEVFAMGANLVDAEIGKLGDIDTCVISLKMSNGALCVIDSSREAQYGYDQRLEVFGSKGSVLAQNVSATRTQLSLAEGIIAEKPHYSFVERYQDAYREQFGEFFDALLNGKEPMVNANDTKKAVEIALAAKRSFELQQPIKLERV